MKRQQISLDESAVWTMISIYVYVFVFICHLRDVIVDDRSTVCNLRHDKKK